jgi:hypothetical protein
MNPKLNHLILMCLGNFAAISPDVRDFLITELSLSDIELLYHARPVSSLVQQQVLRLVLNFVLFPTSDDFKTRIVDFLLGICDNCAESQLPMVSLTLAYLSDSHGFVDYCRGTKLPQFLSKVLTSRNSQILVPTLHILRSVYLELNTDEILEMPRLVALLSERNVDIVNSVCRILAILARRLPQTIEGFESRIVQVLRARIENDQMKGRAACFYCLTWILRVFPNCFADVVNPGFIQLLCNFLELEDDIINICALMLLSYILERDRSLFEPFIAMEGLQRIAELAQSDAAEVAEKAEGCFRTLEPANAGPSE